MEDVNLGLGLEAQPPPDEADDEDPFLYFAQHEGLLSLSRHHTLVHPDPPPEDEEEEDEDDACLTGRDLCTGLEEVEA